MFEEITLNDASGAPVTLHRTATRGVTKAAGLVTISAVRSVARVRPTAHGGVNQSRWTDAALPVIEGLVKGADPLAELALIQEPMLETLDVGPALLKWEESGSGLLKQKLVTLTGEFQAVPDALSPTVIRYQAQFYAEDPRAYSQTLKTVTSLALSTSGGKIYPKIYPRTYDPSAGGTVAVVNDGNRPTPAVFRVYGDCTTAQLVLVGSDKRIALQGRIFAGDFLEIDTQARTLKLNGTSPALSYIDAANTNWFELPRGASSVQMIAGAFDPGAHFQAEFRDAYI